MKLLLLSDVNSTHTQKWAESLSDKGFDIGIFSLIKPETDWFCKYKNIKVLSDGNITLKTHQETSLTK